MGGADPRSGGSGNIGATNVLRTLGKKAAVATLVGDLLKGVIAVLIARLLLPEGSGWLYPVAFAAICGHDFSFLLNFKGGKGVATTFGTLLALHPLVALLCLLTWIAVVAVTRYSSAGALSAASLSPVYAVVVAKSGAMAVFCLFAAALLSWLHRENIKRLAAGTESRVGEKSE
jgi:glycerol-3-phosphate acyltransferase PlsY